MAGGSSVPLGILSVRLGTGLRCRPPPGRSTTAGATTHRYEAARLAAIARRCGLAAAETFRQAFVAWAGVPPSRFRAAER
ncbi:hypothetical protein ACU635_25375 [[Actinomadura] parvosata]|uniref:hypothetical protein n=1 Tax=[Actinomadura] parvosata TaxID=1955412 RepID=UPI00406D1077